MPRQRYNPLKVMRDIEALSLITYFVGELQFTQVLHFQTHTIKFLSILQEKNPA